MSATAKKDPDTVFSSSSTNECGPVSCSTKKDPDTVLSSSSTNKCGSVSCSTIEGPKIMRLFMVRHGERVDETDQRWEWKNKVQPSRFFDPPLTANGQQQAEMAGRTLQKMNGLTEETSPMFAHIFASTTSRTLTTAHSISAALPGSNAPIVGIPGLAQCALAVKKGTKRLHWPSFDDMKKNACKNLLCISSEEDLRNGHPLSGRSTFSEPATIVPPPTFLGSCEFILSHTFSASPDGTPVWTPKGVDWDGPRNVLMVSHREGIRDLAAECGLQGRLGRLPYCAIGIFEFDLSTKKWAGSEGLRGEHCFRVYAPDGSTLQTESGKKKEKNSSVS